MRSRRAFNAGVSAFFLAIASALVPMGSFADVNGWRWLALGTVAAAFVLGAGWKVRSGGSGARWNRDIQDQHASDRDQREPSPTETQGRQADGKRR